ncbi:MAG: TonB family protein [Burkholderiales bacterium]|nr:TonB family protein [Burkholderiales bacterium]
MSAAAIAPRAPGARAAGGFGPFLLALAVHGLLVVALFFGIRWQSRPPAVVEAELWTEPPRAVTAPPPPAPAAPPRETVQPEAPPPKPDIAIRDEARKPPPKRDERPKPEPKREERPKADPRKDAPAADDPVKAALLKEELRRQAAQELQREAQARSAAADAAAQAAKGAAEWNARVGAKVRSRIPYAVAAAVAGNPEAWFEVSLLPGLEVGTVRLVKSSGNAAYDEAAERAIKAASPLPPPTSDRITPPRILNLRMRPKDE